MTFLQWLKKHKNDSEETQLLFDIIVPDKKKPKRCKCMDEWVNYLKGKKSKKSTIKSFHQVWKRFIIHTKLNELGESVKRTDSFLAEFKGKKKDTVLFSKIMSTLETLNWEITKEKEWLYLANNDWDQVFFRPSESGKGFIILSEYAPPELIPYGASGSEIRGRIAHILEFNEAYRLKYHEEELG